MKNEDTKLKIFIAVMCGALALLILLASIDYRECKAEGGVLVRGAFWLQCVKPIK